MTNSFKRKLFSFVAVVALSPMGLFFVNTSNATITTNSAGSCWFDRAGGCDSGGNTQCTQGSCDGDVVVVQ